MTTLRDLIDRTTRKENFKTVADYVEFCQVYLAFIVKHQRAAIIAQNENHYQFYQYDQEGGFQITRPINSELMYTTDDFGQVSAEFIRLLSSVREIKPGTSESHVLNRAVYTIQQSIGAALDALPAGRSNQARKLNGDLFETFVRLLIREIGIECRAGVVKVPVVIDGKEQFSMNYQHDLIVDGENDYKLIGSVKTSSKDRIDKIFVDKFLYNKLTNSAVPHIAVFLNDVQRKNTKEENKYGVSATFLPGHFKGYTIKLNPLDGVYYCDIRPNMKTEPILKDHIRTLDYLLCQDIWRFVD